LNDQISCGIALSQLNDNDKYREISKRVFVHMNVEYTAVMRRFGSRGSFANWDGASPSVWLTAWVVRIFTDVSFQDWEDFIYIDPKVNSTRASTVRASIVELGRFLARAAGL
jgi:hypothetical protein